MKNDSLIEKQKKFFKQAVLKYISDRTQKIAKLLNLPGGRKDFIKV